MNKKASSMTSEMSKMGKMSKDQMMKKGSKSMPAGMKATMKMKKK